jgi:hypothetical protein
MRLRSKMSFLKKIQKIVASDGPEGGLDHGASNPLNWVTTLQSGKSDREVYTEAKRLCEIITDWQKHALEANHIFDHLMRNGGLQFEKHSPDILKGCSREKLEHIIRICERLKQAAPTV